MKTVAGYNTYIEKSKNYVLHAIEARTLFVEIKYRKLKQLDSKEKFREFKRFIEKQEDLTQDLKLKKKHLIHYALSHVEDLKCNSKIKYSIQKKLHQLRIVYTWTFSQSQFLLMQKKALKLEYDYKILHKRKIRYFFAKIFRQTLEHQLLKEESELFLTMKIFEHRKHEFFFYSQEMRKLEKFSKFEKIFLKTAIFCNTLPIHGVGDMLSLPFWIMYGILQGYEHTFKDYKDWKNTKKMSLKKLHEELDKIEHTF